jgi:hypothetical protein
MPAAARSWVLVAGWTVATLLAASFPPLAAAAAAATDDSGGAGFFVLFAIALAAIAFLTATVGLVLLLRVPGNRVGSLMYVGGPLFAASCIARWGVPVLFETSAGPTDAGAGLVALWGGLVLPLAIFVGFTAVGTYFPDGQLPSRRLRVPFGVLIVGFMASSVLYAVAPWPSEGEVPANPLALPGLPVAVSELAVGMNSLSLLASFGLAAWAAVVRWRRSQGIERAQMKWFVFSLTVALVLFPLSWLTDIGGEVVDLASVASMALVPIAVGVAILRYRLYEIDRIISRTLGWGLVTGLLVAVFAGGVIALQTVLAGFTQGQTLAVAASTLVAFSLFQPVRRRVQAAVDRRFDRARYDGERIVSTFAERLRADVDLGEVVDGMRATVEATVRPVSAGVWIRGDAR